MKVTYKTYKFRIYPNAIQKELMGKHFGCVRFIYNLALETKIECYKKGVSLSCYDLQKQIRDLKNDCQFLSEVSRDCLDRSIFNLLNAYNGFFKGKQFPNLKKKTSKNSFYIKQYVSVKNGILYIPKFREGISIVEHRKIEGKIKSATISKTSTGKYYASILCECLTRHLPINDNVVGIDFGLKSFAVTSDNKTFKPPQFLRSSIDRLAILQRRASRKKLGSFNRKKANLRVALLHERIANQRANFLHDISSQITNDYGTVCIEDLAVRNMVKNHNLALSISDASWGSFSTMLSYKSEWKGRELIKIGRFEPTSKTCSGCGLIKNMPLTERTYNCECGLSMDRDLNAAINIRNAGILRTEASVELLPMGKTVKQKTSRQNTLEYLN